jgi:hypothetical protein
MMARWLEEQVKVRKTSATVRAHGMLSQGVQHNRERNAIGFSPENCHNPVTRQVTNSCQLFSTSVRVVRDSSGDELAPIGHPRRHALVPCGYALMLSYSHVGLTRELFRTFCAHRDVLMGFLIGRVSHRKDSRSLVDERHGILGN